MAEDGGAEIERLRRAADTVWRLSGGSIAPVKAAASSEAEDGATSADSECDAAIGDIMIATKDRGGHASNEMYEGQAAWYQLAMLMSVDEVESDRGQRQCRKATISRRIDGVRGEIERKKKRRQRRETPRKANAMNAYDA